MRFNLNSYLERERSIIVPSSCISTSEARARSASAGARCPPLAALGCDGPNKTKL